MVNFFMMAYNFTRFNPKENKYTMKKYYWFQNDSAKVAFYQVTFYQAHFDVEKDDFFSFESSVMLV